MLIILIMFRIIRNMPVNIILFYRKSFFIKAINKTEYIKKKVIITKKSQCDRKKIFFSQKIFFRALFTRGVMPNELLVFASMRTKL